MGSELTKSKFAQFAGVTKQAINGAVMRQIIPTLENGNIDIDHPDCVIYVKKAKLNKIKNKEKLDRERFESGGGVDAVVGSAGKRKRSNDSALGGRPTKEEQNSEQSNDRRSLELRKLHAQAVSFELKNMMARGELGNIKFIEDLFFTQLSYAIKQFLTLPESTVDDLISMAITDGMGARTKIVNKMKKNINAINAGAKNGWVRNIERIKADFVVDIEDQENV